MKKLIVFIIFLGLLLLPHSSNTEIDISSGTWSISSGTVSMYGYDQMWIDSEYNSFLDSENNIFIGATP